MRYRTSFVFASIIVFANGKGESSSGPCYLGKLSRVPCPRIPTPCGESGKRNCEDWLPLPSPVTPSQRRSSVPAPRKGQIANSERLRAAPTAASCCRGAGHGRRTDGRTGHKHLCHTA